MLDIERWTNDQDGILRCRPGGISDKRNNLLTCEHFSPKLERHKTDSFI
jgi:hypothetical protein